MGRKYRRNRRHIVYRQPQGETGGDAGESADTARASSGAEQHRPALPNDKGTVAVSNNDSQPRESKQKLGTMVTTRSKARQLAKSILDTM